VAGNLSGPKGRGFVAESYVRLKPSQRNNVVELLPM
jgi:hypothetical protein